RIVRDDTPSRPLAIGLAIPTAESKAASMIGGGGEIPIRRQPDPPTLPPPLPATDLQFQVCAPPNPVLDSLNRNPETSIASPPPKVGPSGAGGSLIPGSHPQIGSVPASQPVHFEASNALPPNPPIASDPQPTPPQPPPELPTTRIASLSPDQDLG